MAGACTCKCLSGLVRGEEGRCITGEEREAQREARKAKQKKKKKKKQQPKERENGGGGRV